MSEMLDQYMGPQHGAARLRDELVAAQQEVRRLTAEAEDCRSVEATATRRMVDAEANAKIVQLEADTTRHELGRVQAERDDATAAVERLEERCEALSTRLQAARDECAHWQKEADGLRRSEAEAREHMTNMQARFEDTVAKLRAADSQTVDLASNAESMQIELDNALAKVQRLTTLTTEQQQQLNVSTARVAESDRQLKELRLETASARTRDVEIDRERRMLEDRIASGDRAVSQLRLELGEANRQLALANAHLEWNDDDRGRLLRLWHEADRERLAVTHARDFLRDRIDTMIARSQEEGQQQDTGASDGAAAQPTAAQLATENELLRAKVTEMHTSTAWSGETIERGFIAAAEVHHRFEVLQQRVVRAEAEALRADTYAKTCNERAEAAEQSAQEHAAAARTARENESKAEAQWEEFKRATDAAKQALTAITEAKQACEIREAAALAQEAITATRAASAEKNARRAEEDRRTAVQRMQEAHEVADAKAAIAREAELRVVTVDQRIAEANERAVDAEARLGCAELDAAAARVRAQELDDEVSLMLKRCTDAEQQAHRADLDRRAAQNHTLTADVEAAEAVRKATASDAEADRAKARERQATQHAEAMTGRAGTAEETAERLSIEKEALQNRVEVLDQRASTAEAVADHLASKCKMFEQEAMAAQRRAHDVQKLTKATDDATAAVAQGELHARMQATTVEREDMLASLSDAKRQVGALEAEVERKSRQIALLRGEVSLMRDAVDGAGITVTRRARPPRSGSATESPAALDGTVSELGFTLGDGLHDDQLSVAATADAGLHLVEESTTIDACQRNEEYGRGLVARTEASHFLRMQAQRAHEAEVLARFASRSLIQLRQRVFESDLDAQDVRERDAGLIVSARSADERAREALKQLAECETRLQFFQSAHADVVTAVHDVVRSQELTGNASMLLLTAIRSGEHGANANAVYESKVEQIMSAPSEIEVATLRKEVADHSDALAAARQRLALCETEAEENRARARDLQHRIAELHATLSSTEGRLEDAVAESEQRGMEAARAERVAAKLQEDVGRLRQDGEELRGALADANSAVEKRSLEADKRGGVVDDLTKEAARLGARVERLSRSEQRATDMTERAVLLADAVEEKMAIVAAASRSLAPLLRMGYGSQADVLEERVRELEFELANARKGQGEFAPTSAAAGAEATPSQTGAPLLPGDVDSAQPLRDSFASSAMPPGRPTALPRSAITFRSTSDTTSEVANTSFRQLTSGGTPVPTTPRMVVAGFTAGDCAALDELVISTTQWLEQCTNLAMSSFEERSAAILDGVEALAAESGRDARRAAERALDDAQLARNKVAGLSDELADANDAVLMSVKRVKELERARQEYREEMDEQARQLFEANRTIAELEKNEAAAHRRVQELEDTVREAQIEARRVPVARIAERDEAWQTLSTTQRDILERAVAYERLVGELEEKNRDLVKANGLLERDVRQHEKQVATTLENERSALESTAELKKALGKKSDECDRLKDDLGDLRQQLHRSREAEEETRRAAAGMQAKLQELEMASRMQRFFVSEELTARASRTRGASGDAPDDSAVVPDVSPVRPHPADGNASSILREAIQLCAASPATRSPAPESASVAASAHHDGGADDGASSTSGAIAKHLTPSLAELTDGGVSSQRAVASTTRGVARTTFNRDAASTQTIAEALAAVSGEMKQLAARQREGTEARRRADREAAREEECESLADLRALLSSRATKLRQQELNLIEYQQRFQAFEAAVEERLRALAREERDARFLAKHANDTRHDILRLAVVALNQRRRTRQHLQSLEQRMMQRFDGSPTATVALQTDPSVAKQFVGQMKSGLAAGVAAGVAAASPARYRAPIEKAINEHVVAVSSLGPMVLSTMGLIVVACVLGIVLMDIKLID